MKKLFISYASKDRPYVRHLVEALKRYGYDVWWDQEIAGGQPYREVINDVLAKVDCVVSVWSETAIESDWVIGEAELAFQQNKLIPISMDGTQPPINFRQLHILDLQEWFKKPLLSELPFLIQSIEKITAIEANKARIKVPLMRQVWDRIRFSGWGYKLVMLVIAVAIVFYPIVSHRIKKGEVDQALVYLVRGEFSTLREFFNAREHQPISMEYVISNAKKVGDKFKAIPDESLFLARRVTKHEHIGWAYILGSIAIVEDGRSKYPTVLVDDALQHLTLALELEKELQENMDEALNDRMHRKMVAHLEKYHAKQRIIRMVAIAYALQACFGDEKAKEKVDEQMEKLSKSHLTMYPVVNDFLKFYYTSEDNKDEKSRPAGCV